MKYTEYGLKITLEELRRMLERAEKEHDTEAAAALRWAIF